MAWTHKSVHLEAKHNVHLLRPLMLYCTGEESGLVNQIHWHESYTLHTIPCCSYAQHISLHYGIIFLCLSCSFLFSALSLSLTQISLLRPVRRVEWKSIVKTCSVGKNTIFAFAVWLWYTCEFHCVLKIVSPDESFTWAQGSILSCPAMFKSHLLHSKECPKINTLSCCFKPAWLSFFREAQKMTLDSILTPD